MEVYNRWRARSRQAQSGIRTPSRRRARIDGHSTQLELALSFERQKAGPPPSNQNKPNESLMTDEIVLMREVVRRTKRHRSTIYRWMERDEFPRQIKTRRGRAIGWSRNAFESWMNAPSSAALMSEGRE